MFELLLQADKALADGALDQAERTYWQLIELDPSNAIAVAGLARVSLQRGDERLARTFADRALGIDPESIVARRVLGVLMHEAIASDEGARSDLPLLAAERLEALSRRRGMGETEAAPDEPRRVTTKGARKHGGAGKGARGHTRPDQIAPLPAELLRERRQAGRLGAAAAAAAAAAREPVRPRHEPHRAMPMGRRLFEPRDLKAPPSDAFSEAEMAAAVEAVDAIDEAAPASDAAPAAMDVAAAAATAEPAEDVVAIAALPAFPVELADATAEPSARPAEELAAAGGLVDVLGAVDATEADESVAMRIALLSGAAGPDEPGADEFEAAEAMAVSQANWPAVRPPHDTPMAEPAAEDAAEADAAETAAAAEALHEIAAAHTAPEAAAEPQAAAEPVTPRPRRSARRSGGAEASEEEAEAEALREAMAIVLGGEGESRPTDLPVPSAPLPPAAEPAPLEAEPAPTVAEPAPLEAEPAPTAAEPAPPATEPTETLAADPTVPTPSKTEPPDKERSDVNTPRRKQGLFRRFRGS